MFILVIISLGAVAFTLALPQLPSWGVRTAGGEWRWLLGVGLLFFALLLLLAYALVSLLAALFPILQVRSLTDALNDPRSLLGDYFYFFATGGIAGAVLTSISAAVRRRWRQNSLLFTLGRPERTVSETLSNLAMVLFVMSVPTVKIVIDIVVIQGDPDLLWNDIAALGLVFCYGLVLLNLSNPSFSLCQEGLATSRRLTPWEKMVRARWITTAGDPLLHLDLSSRWQPSLRFVVPAAQVSQLEAVWHAIEDAPHLAPDALADIPIRSTFWKKWLPPINASSQHASCCAYKCYTAVETLWIAISTRSAQ